MAQKRLNPAKEMQITRQQIDEGINLRVSCLNMGDNLKSCSDKEIIGVLQKSYVFHEGNRTSEVCKVVVRISFISIDICDEVTDDIFFSFPLRNVRDISKGLQRHSKFLVLVAKECDDETFKAYTFYSKVNTERFYKIVKRAFQLANDDLGEKYSTGKLSDCFSCAFMNRPDETHCNLLEKGQETRSDNVNDYDISHPKTKHILSTIAADEFKCSFQSDDETCLLHPNRSLTRYFKKGRNKQNYC